MVLSAVFYSKLCFTAETKTCHEVIDWGICSRNWPIRSLTALARRSSPLSMKPRLIILHLALNMDVVLVRFHSIVFPCWMDPLLP
jgi:hypothetical protein